MKHSLIVGILCLTFIGCKLDHNTDVGNTSIKEHFDFPDDWLGRWHGTLNIYNESGKKQEVPMQLINRVTEVQDSFRWAIIYGEDTISGLRDYSLIAEDKEMGRYKVDEKNGIILDAQLIENELISVFSVAGNTLTTTYKMTSGGLVFEILMYKTEAVSTTGDTIINGEEIPEVKNYQPKIIQKALLKKKE